METGEPILRVQNVVKTYREGPTPVVALNDVSLTVQAGRFIAVMGPSGSGKSTLLNLVGGLEQADKGGIFIDGENLSTLSDHKLSLFRRRKIGFIFQHLNLLPTLTASENVAVPMLIDNFSFADVADGVARALETVGLSQRGGHRPDALSGGEQQRVAIARCLLMSPAVILADEPTGNLDTANGTRVLEVLHGLTRGDHSVPANPSRADAPRRHTVVMVTHEARAAAYADAVYFLRDGKVVGLQDLDGKHDAAFVADCYQRHERAPSP